MSTAIIKAGSTLTISYTLNGTEVSAEVTAETPLSTLLRDGQGLTGVKIACASGVCGSCTALINGKPVTTCTAFAYQANGRMARQWRCPRLSRRDWTIGRDCGSSDTTGKGTAHRILSYV